MGLTIEEFDRLNKALTRLERLLPALQRPGALRRGQVYLSTDEAWDLMTRTGLSLEAEKEIVKQLAYVREWGGRFLVPIPEVRVIS